MSFGIDELRLIAVIITCCYLAIKYVPPWRERFATFRDQHHIAGYNFALTLLGFATVLSFPPKGLGVPMLLLIAGLLLFLSFWRDRATIASFSDRAFRNLPLLKHVNINLYIVCFVLLLSIQGLFVIVEAINTLNIVIAR